ncbi:MAG: DNA recombination protein RmuC [Baileyella intestinalis]|uniref:DNA recombination protein RmuC n=1 Tax=Baileyella intestinalis TaxID=2606709 RepID=UPI0023F442F0|nr:DNA recombination protein RmuC [Baileyella intestinalis]MDD5874539.1 DNA recombination protein RmuC [Baileyella intestinalis]
MTGMGAILIGIISVAALVLSALVLVRIHSYSEKLDTYFSTYGRMISDAQSAMARQQDDRLRSLDENFSRLRTENNMQMENIRQTVDERMQKSLDSKLTQSFSLVNERLEQVYKGLGEMQQVAEGVGDLKKILSNVKTRGILGEVQLETILSEILTKDQYDVNVATRPGSRDRVEFAIKLPGDGHSTVYLPVDAKFPGNTYAALLDAYDYGDKEEIQRCTRELVTTIMKEAKDIQTKYLEPPATTDFAIMFLPFEGLYAEVVRAGLIETLQRKYRVTIAGPTTMSALLNSLQMGFNTLAIEKRSDQVWKLLGAVRTEFDTFQSVLESTQMRINQANDDLDRLVGVRTRQIRRKLQNVAQIDQNDARRILDQDIPSGEGE